MQFVIMTDTKATFLSVNIDLFSVWLMELAVVSTDKRG